VRWRWSTLALIAVVVAVLGGLWSADRALRAAEAAAGSGDVARLDELIAAARSVRVALWAITVGALAALTVALWHERAQARRVAERSAELERLSGELLRANRAKSEFLANVSHELRTPLSAIVGFVEMLQDGDYGTLTPRQAGPVRSIQSSAEHLRTLVDQILDLARLAAGRVDLHREPVDLRAFVLALAAELEPIAQAKGLALSLAVGATLPRVRTDPGPLRQILVNLIGNAVKFTAEGGVRVHARLVTATPRAGEPTPAALPAAHGVWVAVAVTDTGVGIAPEDRERIFEEFEQVAPGARADSGRRGTGLGLAISRRLARALGGEITVDAAPGRGSTFTVWLPVDPADLAAA
jgi:signal transduction histidine kinase